MGLPNTINRVNAIIDFWSDPCEAPWDVFLQTALPAAGEAAMAVIDFDLGQFNRAFFSPGNRRSRRHGRPGKKSGGLADCLLNPSECLGKRLRTLAGNRPRRAGKGEKFLWAIDDVLQRGLFWWMVLDVGEEFLFNWQSAMMRTEFCQAKNDGVVKAGPKDEFWSTLGGWAPRAVGPLQKLRGPVTWSPGRAGSSGGSSTAVFKASGRNESSEERGFGIGLWTTGNTNIQPQITQFQTLQPGESAQMTVSASGAGPRTYQAAGITTNGGMFVDQVQMVMFQRNS